MITGLIAEIGNHHFGDIGKARELIRAARDCGAAYAKFQAIDPETFTGGSMPRDFYWQCDLGLDGYLSLEDYGRQLGIPVFFSVFGPKYEALKTYWPGKPYKIAGGQFGSMSDAELKTWNDQDRNPVIVSVPSGSASHLWKNRDVMTNMHVMYVTPYLPERVEFFEIFEYEDALHRSVGYSDHCRGVISCLIAIDDFGCRLIEKHFNLFGRQSFQGRVYRDSIHAASAPELTRLATHLSNAR